MPNANERIQVLIHKSKVFLKNFNLFPSIPPSTDEHQLQNERISSRLFIVLFISSLFILLLYTSLVNVTQTVTIKAPTITQYSQLYSRFPQTLTCPCSTISINYDTFLHVNYTLHQVCNSVFVTQPWISYLSTSHGGRPLYTEDFRWTSTSAFQGLSAFCELIDQTISYRLMQFYLTQYVSASVTSLQVFDLETKVLISQFISSTTNEFLLLLSTIRSTTQTNGLYSARQTNYGLYALGPNSSIITYALSYGNCNCGSSAACAYGSNIYDSPNTTILFSVPGIYTGCYVVESLLQSDLRCFYNQTCINNLQSYLYPYLSMNVTSLDKSLLVRFFDNSTVQEFLDKLMVEEWKKSIIYEDYYNKCQPSQCTYTHQTKNSAIYIVTTVVGLIGGLLTVLKLTVPRLVKLVAFCIRKWRGRRTTITPIILT